MKDMAAPFWGGLLRGEKKGGSGFLRVPCGTARGGAALEETTCYRKAPCGFATPPQATAFAARIASSRPLEPPIARLLAGGVQTPLCNGR